MLHGLLVGAVAALVYLIVAWDSRSHSYTRSRMGSNWWAGCLVALYQPVDRTDHRVRTTLLG